MKGVKKTQFWGKSRQTVEWNRKKKKKKKKHSRGELTNIQLIQYDARYQNNLIKNGL